MTDKIKHENTHLYAKELEYNSDVSGKNEGACELDIRGLSSQAAIRYP